MSVLNRIHIILPLFCRGDTSWLHTMKNAIHEVENGTAVIILGWGQGHSTMSYLRDLFHYHQVAANVR